jgi:predicted TIM-barrel fold metal-dependent hydrolase
MSGDALWNGSIVDAHQHFWDPTLTITHGCNRVF